MAFKVIVVLICIACCVMALPAPDNDKTVTGSEAVPAVPSDAGTPPKDLDTAGTFYAGIGVYPYGGYGFPGYSYGGYGGYGGYGYGYGYRYPGYGRYGYGYPYYW
jgi:hypothetical protein